jgi:hypothetical protein
MNERLPYNYRGLMLAAMFLSCSGWLGLYLLMMNTLPTLGSRWLYYVAWTSAATGTALPFLWLLNKRFRSESPASPKILLREALLFGLWAAICLWLRLNLMLNLKLALLIGIGISTIEWLLRLIERSTWKPGR